MSDEPTPITRDTAIVPMMTPETVEYRLKLVQRTEKNGADGMVYAQSAFMLIAPGGTPLCEETADGPMPLMIVSAPQSIRRAVLSTGPKLVRR